MNLKIASASFEKHAPEMIKEGATREDIIAFFLPDLIEDIAEEWGYELTAYTPNIENTIALISYDFKNFILENSGELFQVKFSVKETGGVIWNGDDMYYREIESIINSKVLIDTCENISSLLSAKAINADDLESAACEVVSVICQ